MALFVIIAKLAAESAINAHAYKTFEGEDPVRIPIWPVWATISVSSLLLAVEYFRQLFRPFMAVPDNNAAHADSE